MMKKRLSKTLWYGTDVDSYGNPIIPLFTADPNDLNGLHVGELFLHYSGGMATLWTANESGNVVKISGGEGGVDLSPYLLISEFNKIWEIRTDSQGAEYIFGKLPVVTQYGITMYSGESVNVPTIAEGMPFDNRTIWFNPETGLIEVIGGTGGGSGEGVSNFWELSGIPSWITNTKPTYSYSEIQGTPDLSKYALVSQIPSLNGYATESWVLGKGYATVSDLDGRINALINGAPQAYDTLKEIADVLHGNVNSIGDIITTLGGKADKATTLGGYGITDAYTKTNVDNLLKAYVTLAGTNKITTLGTITTGTWNGTKIANDYLANNKVSISGVDVSLGSGISQSALRTALGLGSNAYTSTEYLPLSGGNIESSSGSPLRINSTHQGGSAIVFLHNGADKSWFGYDKNVGRTYMYNTASQSYLGVRDNGTPYYNSYTLWHSGNDGSGSGLDADLLDGKHNGELTALYVKSQNVTTDDFSTYLNTYGNQGLSVLSNMSGADVGDIPTICSVLNIGSTATRLGRFIFMRNDQSDGLWWQSANSAYNGWGAKRKVAFVDSNVATATRIQAYTYNGSEKIIVSGTRTDSTYNRSIYDNGYTYRLKDDARGVDADIATVADNVASATKLQTVRYIWGRSFDGTGNITGDLEMGNNIILKQRDTGGNSLHTIYTSTSNNLVIGIGHAVKGYNTYLDGNTLFFRYGTAPSIGMILNSSGNVTIGSSDLASTNAKLYVDGAIRSTNYIYSDSLLWFKKGSEGIYIGHNAICWHNSGAAWVSNLIGFESNKVTINQSTTVQGDFLSTGGITMYSARKLKDIKDERGLSLEELSVIKPTRFTWKDGRDSKIHIGGIADDVMKVLPEVIYKTDDDTLTMDYGNAAFAIAASLIKPVISHEEEIKALKNRIKELEEQVKTLSWNIA